MAKDLYEASPAAREVFDRADSALGESLSTLILDGPEGDLTLTANTQPAIVTVSTAVVAALRERTPNAPPPRFAAGHSLGEYSALVAAGALSFEDAVRIVRARGLAMQNAVPAGVGAMAAIMGLEPDAVNDLCARATADVEGNQIVSPANFNAPGQVVVAGHAAAVERMAALVSDAKGRAIPLKVSAPFHCALMKPAAAVVQRELAKVSMATPAFPIVANFTAKPNGDADKAKQLLVDQVDGPVRWSESVGYIASEGVTHALELGPGKVLAGLVKRIAKDLKVMSVGDMASLDAVASFLSA